MSTLPYMPWFLGDYFGDTRHLTRDQHGGYLLLLAAMWSGGGSLPNDADVLRQVALATPKEWERLWVVLRPFFIIEGGRVVSQRLAKEWARTNKVRESRRQSSQQAVIARALKKAGVHRQHSSNGQSNGAPFDTPNEQPNDTSNVEPYVGISRKEESKSLSSDGAVPQPRASLQRTQGARSLAAVPEVVRPEPTSGLARRYEVSAALLDATAKLTHYRRPT